MLDNPTGFAYTKRGFQKGYPYMKLPTFGNNRVLLRQPQDGHARSVAVLPNFSPRKGGEYEILAKVSRGFLNATRNNNNDVPVEALIKRVIEPVMETKPVVVSSMNTVRFLYRDIVPFAKAVYHLSSYYQRIIEEREKMLSEFSHLPEYKEELTKQMNYENVKCEVVKIYLPVHPTYEENGVRIIYDNDRKRKDVKEKKAIVVGRSIIETNNEKTRMKEMMKNKGKKIQNVVVKNLENHFVYNETRKYMYDVLNKLIEIYPDKNKIEKMMYER